MAFINKSAKEIQVKVVYYGPGRCGKTTNLLYVNQKMNAQFMGKMISIDTRGDKTLFFDFLPLSLGKIRGFNIRVQLYTVPGQVLYNESRKMVLKGVDGVVFVADSMEVQAEANKESLQNLRENLAEDNLDMDELPLVLQLNKRDLEGSVIPVMAREAMEVDLNSMLKNPAPTVLASALQGPGVFETLREISKITIKSVHHKLKSS
ncbi:GTP-binding protein [Desulfomonile tiedjei]|uniref:Putative GTPase n=1 Tax=Desulfomonile tiedjei (strain ATCC 49306 / DSM 6799 / DCB-1) TaxID=706587 RepID=I4C3G8_DESTA|nr:GTPase domain-containing protein [Desulfomonile tiedjei]AFM24109.1 putative GTPase [Desulfomonile tiedjei DSM 6799]